MKRLVLLATIGTMVFVIGATAGYAGNIQATVSLAGGPVAGAQVVAEPGHVTGTTNAHGQCTLTHVPATPDGRVVAFADIAGLHYGAVADHVAVPAHGHVPVNLNLAEAIEMPTYLPLELTNFWRYQCHDSHSAFVRDEDVIGTRPLAGRTACVLQVRRLGSPDTSSEFVASDAEGYWQFGQSYSGVEELYSPPAFYPNHFPLGYSWSQEYDVVDGGGGVLAHDTATIELAAFETVTVPAGTFAHCARIVGTFTHGAEVVQSTIWLAPGVGVVKVIDVNMHGTFQKELTDFGKRLPMLRPVRPLVKPIPLPTPFPPR